MLCRSNLSRNSNITIKLEIRKRKLESEIRYCLPVQSGHMLQFGTRVATEAHFDAFSETKQVNIEILNENVKIP